MTSHPSPEAKPSAGWASLPDDVLRRAAESTGDVFYAIRTDPDFGIEFLSDSVVALTGYVPDDYYGDPDLLARTTEPEDLAALVAAVESPLGDDISVDLRLLHRDGTMVWTQHRARKRVRPDGTVILEGSGRDVTQLHLTQEALAASERRFRLAMAEAPNGMAVIDLDLRFLEVNASLERILGHRRLWLLDHYLGDVIDPLDRDGTIATLQSLLEGRTEHVSREHRYVRSDDVVIWIQESIGLLRGPNGEPVSYVCQLQDVTELRNSVAQLEHLAAHDGLTGLPNRGELLRVLTQALQHQPRTGKQLGVLFCDVDELKLVNDAHGHAAGDALLMAIGQRMSGALRATDSVARVSGDEFVVVLDGVHDTADAERLAQLIRAAVAVPIRLDGQLVTPALSIGVAVAEMGQAADEVLLNADRALYLAKHDGRDRIAVFAAAPVTGC